MAPAQVIDSLIEFSCGERVVENSCGQDRKDEEKMKTGKKKSGSIHKQISQNATEFLNFRLMMWWYMW